MQKWAIITENIEYEDNTYYFESEELARESFRHLCDKYKYFDEYEHEVSKDNKVEYANWFDARYEEYAHARVVLVDIIINDKVITQ